jgi:APA family basic amino acid/polyamine antiporter
VFEKVSKKYRTPVVATVVFSAVAVVELIFAALQGNGGFNFLGDLYAFGAAASYTLVFCALIALRLNDPLTPRKFLIPGNVAMMFRGERVLFPLVGIIGLMGILSILVFVLLTHPIGRIAGPSWLILGTIGYIIYRKKKGLPLFGSQKRDWSAAQLSILRESGELELMDELAEKLRVRKVAAEEATPT